jgi:hypothetical protein
MARTRLRKWGEIPASCLQLQLCRPWNGKHRTPSGAFVEQLLHGRSSVTALPIQHARRAPAPRLHTRAPVLLAAHFALLGRKSSRRRLLGRAADATVS